MAFQAMGNACTTAFRAAVGTYTPRNVLRYAARRMLLTPEDVDACFPDHGYADGTDFLQHLRGVNEFFCKTRSRAAGAACDVVVKSLGEYSGPKKTRKFGSSSSRRAVASKPSCREEDPDPVVWPGIADNELVTDAIAGCEERHTLNGLLGHKHIQGLNTEETIVEAVNRQLNANVRSGSISYDVAAMRLCYIRLKWDSAALRRILYGDKSRNRRAVGQAMAVWNLAISVMGPLGSGKDMALFRSRSPPSVRRTTVEELLDMGYKLNVVDSLWNKDESKLFFQSCTRFARCPDVVGNYATPYEWMAYSIFKGTRSPVQIREYAERMYGYRGQKRRRYSSGTILPVSNGGAVPQSEGAHQDGDESLQAPVKNPDEDTDTDQEMKDLCAPESDDEGGGETLLE